MWQTQTSPSRSKARIRSRVSSASARNTSAKSAAPLSRGSGVVPQQEVSEIALDIFALTNISCPAYIRLSEYYKERDMSTPSNVNVKEIVQEKYGAAARSAARGERDAGCCSSDGSGCDPITSNLYDPSQIGTLP